MNEKSIKKNYIYNLICQITILLVPIIVTPYVSRVLLPSGVGEYSFSYSLISYFVAIASLGFTNYAQREIANNQGNKEKQTRIFWEVNICKLIPVCISLFINLFLCFLGVYGEYTLLMLLLSINIVSVGTDIDFIFKGNEDFGKIVFRNILVKVIGVISIFVFVKERTDVWVYAILQSLTLIGGNISLWPLAKKYLVKNEASIHPLKHLKGAFRLFIPVIALLISSMLDKSLIGIITGDNNQNGYYEQSEKIVRIAVTIITCLGTVMIPRNSNEFNKGNIQKVKDNIYVSFHVVWLLGIPLMMGLIFLSDNLIPWFLGVNFMESIVLLKILAFLVITTGVSNVLGIQYLLPTRKDIKYTLSLCIGVFINCILNIVMIYNYKAVGATIATVIAELIVSLIMLYMVRKELSFKKMFSSMIKPTIASIIMFGILRLCLYNLESSILNTVIISSTAMIIYGVLVIALKDEMVIKILKIINKKVKGNN